MTPIVTIGAAFALGFYSFMVWWTFDALTVDRRPRGQESVKRPTEWWHYPAAFFWFIYLPTSLLLIFVVWPVAFRIGIWVLWLCDGKHMNEHRVVPIRKRGV